MLRLLTFCLFVILPITATYAQPDSVTVSGRIRNLTPALYRQAPAVLISRNNLLQGGQELTRPAPLQPDGSYRVTLPLIYPQEELYFTFGNVSTAFLAAPGRLTIDLNADSLFVAAVPFRFGGVNAQVNAQFADYKAYEARNRASTPERVNRAFAGLPIQRGYTYLVTTFLQPLTTYRQQRPVFPLVERWLTQTARADAASFVYDRVFAEQRAVPINLIDSLRIDDAALLTGARAAALNRFGNYAMQVAQQGVTSGQRNSVPVALTAGLVERYGRNLTAQDRARLQTFRQQGALLASELRTLNTLIARNADTLRRLLVYETLLQSFRQTYRDSLTRDFLKAHVVARALPLLTLDIARLFHHYVRPQIGDGRVARSLDELYRLTVSDSARVRAATRSLAGVPSAVSREVAPGIFVSRDLRPSGSASLLGRVLADNRGKVVYVVAWSLTDEGSRQLAADAQRLREVFGPRELTLLYMQIDDSEPNAWLEYVVRTNLRGEHVLLSAAQLDAALSLLPALEEQPVFLIDRRGRVSRREVPLPADLPKLTEQIRKLL